MKPSVSVYQGILAQILLKKDAKSLCDAKKKEDKILTLIRAM